MTRLVGLPVNLRKHSGKETIADIEEYYTPVVEEEDEIDKAINRAEAHVAPKTEVQAVARLISTTV